MRRWGLDGGHGLRLGSMAAVNGQDGMDGSEREEGKVRVFKKNKSGLSNYI